MPCPRCQGLMVEDEFVDLLYDGGYASFPGWRCLCCGNVQDPVIVKNKHGRGAPAEHMPAKEDDTPSPEARILHLLQSSPFSLTIEEITDKLPGLGWNQLFLTIDALSRLGAIVLKRRGFAYEAHIAPQSVDPAVDGPARSRESDPRNGLLRGSFVRVGSCG